MAVKLVWAVMVGLALAVLLTAGLAQAGATAEHRAVCQVQLDGALYPSINAALAAASAGSTVRISGDCQEHDLPVTRTLTLQGGWNSTFTVHDPAVYTTTIDAQGLGRVLVISGLPGAPITPTVRDLTLANGVATLAQPGAQSGGCLYAVYAAPQIINNRLVTCTASKSASGQGRGGGAYIDSGGSATLVQGNLFQSNVALNAADNSAAGVGGGLYYRGPGVIQENTFRSNTGGRAYPNPGWGGGAYLTSGPVQFMTNTVRGNIGSYSHLGYGGGLSLDNLAPYSLLAGNVITSNYGSLAQSLLLTGIGGAAYQQWGGPVTWRDNQVVNNEGNELGGGNGGWGGGIHLASTRAEFTGNNLIQGNTNGPYGGMGGGLYIVGAPSMVTITGATIVENTANGSSVDAMGGGIYMGAGQLLLRNSVIQDNVVSGAYTPGGNRGGGLYVGGGTAVLEHNLFVGNRAGGLSFGGGAALEGATQASLEGNRFFSNTVATRGGGLYLATAGGATLTNNLLAYNASRQGGAAVYAAGPTTLRHTTIHGHSTDTAVIAGTGAVLSMTNTIVSANLTGTQAAGGSLQALRTLFWLNTADGERGLEPLDGDPAFTNPVAGDYHLGPLSAGRDAGVDMGVSDDLDGIPRSLPPDLGAYEYVCLPPSAADFAWIPLLPGAGQAVTFTASPPAGSPPFTYLWAFGDGGSGQGAAASHAYAQSGTYTAWLTASNSCGASGQHHAIQVAAQPVYALSLEPASRSTYLAPDATWNYTHTLRNIGNTADVYNLSVQSSLGWSSLDGPLQAALAPQAAVLVTVSVAVPPGALSGTLETATLRAVSTASPAVWAQAVDTSRVYLPPPQPVYSATLVPAALQAELQPGGSIIFTHVLQNTGNTADTYLLTVHSSRGWSVLLGAPQLALAPGGSAAIQVQSLVPGGAVAGNVEIAGLQAVSVADPALQLQASDTIWVFQGPGAHKLYLPLVSKEAPAGSG